MHRATLILLASLLLSTPGCDDKTAAEATDYSALLQYLGDQVIVPEHDAFATSAGALAEALATLEQTATEANLASARAAWRDARAAFRKLDAVHFGPMVDREIDERIDLGPANESGIEAIIASNDELTSAIVEQAPGESKGFLGIEYLIFADDGLASLTAADGPRRRKLARLMADEIASSGEELADAWRRDGGGYVDQFELAGTDASSRYLSQRSAIDDTVGAVGYAWELVVGIRLAVPLGRKSDGTPHPEADPTRRSDSASADMAATMAGISALYEGDGFSSMVNDRSSGEDELMRSEISDCTTSIEAIPAPFEDAVVHDTAVVQTAYDACKAGKGTWNTDITSVLGATLRPDDTDGD